MISDVVRVLFPELAELTMRKVAHIQDPEVLFHLCMLMVQEKSRDEVERYLLDVKDDQDAAKRL